MLRFYLLAFLFCASVYAAAQTISGPTPVAATCAYNAVLPTSSTGSFVYVQCDSLGRIIIQ